GAGDRDEYPSPLRRLIVSNFGGEPREPAYPCCTLAAATKCPAAFDPITIAFRNDRADAIIRGRRIHVLIGKESVREFPFTRRNVGGHVACALCDHPGEGCFPSCHFDAGFEPFGGAAAQSAELLREHLPK